MPGQVRTNVVAMKIAYKILKTPKDQQQKSESKLSEKKIREWFLDSSVAQ